MKLVQNDFNSVYFVNGKEVENIVLFNGAKSDTMVFNTGFRWLETQRGKRITEISEVTEIASRRKVQNDKNEHFTVNIKKDDEYQLGDKVIPLKKGLTLFLNLDLLAGYSGIVEIERFLDETRRTTMEMLPITATFSEDGQQETVNIVQVIINSVLTPAGESARRLSNHFKEKYDMTVSIYKAHEMLKNNFIAGYEE